MIFRRIIYYTIIIYSFTIITGCASPEAREAENLDINAQENRPGDIYAQMGQEYMKEGQPDVALRKLEHGLSVDPDNAKVHAVLAQIYDHLGEIKLAEEHYRRSIEIEPHNPFYLNAWGGFLCQRSEYDQAEAEFLKALANPLYNQPWEAQTNAGVCALRSGHSETGERYLRLALTTNPNVPLALFKLAELQAKQGKYAEAREHLTRYAKLATPSPQSLLLQCQVAFNLGDKDAAASFKQDLIKHFPDAPETQTAKRLLPP